MWCSEHLRNLIKKLFIPTAKSVLPNEISYTVSKLKYLKSDSKMMYEIKYPHINGLADANKQSRMNAILKDEALKVLNYYGDSSNSLDLDIDYKITLKNENVLSIQYSGLGYVMNAAYPNNLFYTTNINMQTGEKLRLKDIVNISDCFANKFLNGQFKTNLPEHSEAIKDFSIETIKKYFNEADSLDDIGTEKQSDVFTYLTADSLGISIGMSHALGDHAEFEIKYEDIQDNMIYYDYKL